MPTLRLVRGPSGSGKSTFAQTNRRLFSDVFEADDYFVRPDGHYDFNPKLLKNAHDYCFARTARQLRTYADEEFCCGGEYMVIVANTFTRIWEMQRYIDLAEQNAYKLEVYRCTGAYKNVHGVPEEKVIAMRNRMEDYPGEHYV